VLRANWIANTAPCGPTYVNLDAEIQEMKLPDVVAPIDAQRYMPAMNSAAPAAVIAKAAELLRNAKTPVILSGRTTRSVEGWEARVALAERLGARVVTDQKVAASFPTDHPLHAGAPGGTVLAPEAQEAIRNADVILSLDWLDLAGCFKNVGKVPPKVVQVSVDHRLHNGWSMDYQGLAPIDVFIDCTPEAAVPALLEALGTGTPRPLAADAKEFPIPPADGKLLVDHLSASLRKAVGDRPTSLTHVSLSWNGASWHFKHPLDYLGSDGGGGVGGGPGISVGAALALKGSGRLPIAVCGDGDFMMGVTAIWTAAHYKIPVLFVVANNRSFFNDELHQERVARMRSRPVENRWIGQRISEPDIDIAGIARAQGAIGFGPVTKASELADVFAKAIAAVDEGNVVVVDVRVEPGYTAATTAAMTRKGD
jgi:thiamine pyrophosphate-dependent acetolactate synthase large subunit-like protein